MLKQTDRNKSMLSKIHRIIDEIIPCHEDDAPSFALEVKKAIDEANRNAHEMSGTKTIYWISGGSEHVISWVLKQGSIMQVVVKKNQPGHIRISHEQTFFA